MNLIKALLEKNKMIITYGLISCFVTVIDVAVSYMLEDYTGILTANAIGVITGFIIQYFLASKKVFNSQNLKTFIIFLATFFVGLLAAEAIIYIFRIIIFRGIDTKFAFLSSKGMSIVIPFFLIYFMRKKLISKFAAEEEK